MLELNYQHSQMEERLSTLSDFMTQWEEKINEQLKVVGKKIEVVDKLDIGFAEVTKNVEYCCEQLTAPGIIG